MNLGPKINIFLILIVLLTTVITCKSDTVDIIPNQPFRLTLSPNEVLSIGIGTAITKETGGVRGLIIYRLSDTEFQAYDRLCTNYPADTATVVLDKATLIATCPRCKSTFQINVYAQVNKGPAKYALKQYQTSFTGGRLEISN
jgi:Rieske Fe-S protein